MKQQTAVEWLENGIKQLYERDGKLKIGYVIRLIQDTKEMEKEQINKAHYEGYMDGAAKKVIWDDKYYNETYGGAK